MGRARSAPGRAGSLLSGSLPTAPRRGDTMSRNTKMIALLASGAPRGRRRSARRRGDHRFEPAGADADDDDRCRAGRRHGRDATGGTSRSDCRNVPPAQSPARRVAASRLPCLPAGRVRRRSGRAWPVDAGAQAPDGVMTPPRQRSSKQHARPASEAPRSDDVPYGHELVWQRNGKKRFCPCVKPTGRPCTGCRPDREAAAR